MTIARQNFWLGLGVFSLGLIFFVLTLGHAEIIGFESRFYLFAIEMWRHGPSWFSTTYHKPYPDYPGTSTFFVYIISKMLGELSRFTAILPSAIVSSMTLSVTYLIGARQNQVWGLSAVCFLLLTYSFIAEARTISLDQYTTFITALSFYLAMCGRLRWIFPLLVLGFAIRGPIGLVVPTGVLCIYYLLEKDFKKLMEVACVATLLFILCGCVLLMLAYQEGGKAFVDEVIKMQVVGRLQEARKLPWDFYFIESFVAYALVYPIAILIMLGLSKANRVDRKFLLKLSGWSLVVLLGLSIPTNKKIRYILPFAPALALMCGYIFTVKKDNKLLLFTSTIYVYCMYVFSCALLHVIGNYSILLF